MISPERGFQTITGQSGQRLHIFDTDGKRQLVLDYFQSSLRAIFSAAVIGLCHPALEFENRIPI